MLFSDFCGSLFTLFHRTQLSEANDKMLAVQECYISVCKEKDLLEESIRSREKEEALIREESGTAMEKLRRELETQHQASVMELKARWSKEREAELQQQLNSHLASAEAAWKEKLQKVCPIKIAAQLHHLINGDFIQDLFFILNFLCRWRRPGSRGSRRLRERNPERLLRQAVRWMRMRSV